MGVSIRSTGGFGPENRGAGSPGGLRQTAAEPLFSETKAFRRRAEVFG